ncbi:hypothetical protein Tco_0316632 [Tanacetum coccineum]
MKAYLDQMERLGYPMPLVLRVNMILTSLLKDYDQFVQNYNMHCIWKTIPELHAMLKLAEKVIPKKTPVVLTIGKVKSRNLNRKNEARESKESMEKASWLRVRLDVTAPKGAFGPGLCKRGLGKILSRSFRPVKSAESLWHFWTSYSLRVSLAQYGSWSKWEPSLWLYG